MFETFWTRSKPVTPDPDCIRVVVVDRDDTTVGIEREILESLPKRAEVIFRAKDGNEFKRFFKQKDVCDQFDLLICDIRIPFIDPTEMVDTITNKCGRKQVFFVTTAPLAEIRAAQMKIQNPRPMMEYFRKPFLYHELRDKLVASC